MSSHTVHEYRFYHLECVLCGKIFQEEQTSTLCLDCGGALDVKYDYDYIKSRLNYYALRNAPISNRKYLAFYPLQDLNKLVTLNEGGTPLQHCKHLGKKLGMKNLYVKHEGANPTGVFKDRGSLVELTKALELGANAVTCASTGNMAASVSAYASMAKIPCYVLVPDGTPVGKLAQSLIYGARILQIRGVYDDCCRLCEEMADRHRFYLAGDYAFRMEGHKSIAFEIIEQLFWKVPDVVVMPMGCGTNIASVWKGFKEFYEMGFIDRLPRMIGVQPTSVPTIVEAFRKKKKRYVKVDKPYSVASAVGIGAPLDDVKALRALRESHGDAETADDHVILEAEKDMAHLESLFVEPSSALPVACLPQLKERGVISEDDVVVCVATGIGLKDPKSATLVMPDPPVLEPTSMDIDQYLKNKVYEIKAVSMIGKEEAMWKKVPTKAQLKKLVKKEFNLDLSVRHLDEVYRQVKLFQEKKDEMLKAHLQYILENVLKDTVKKRVLEVEDYEVNMTRHTKPVASVRVKFMGKVVKASSDGDGPVDAIINAVKESIKGRDTLKCALTTYNVEINTKGTDAAVEVRMGMKSKEGTEVIGSATSPDIITASTEAFEKGYNILFSRSHSS